MPTSRRFLAALSTCALLAVTAVAPSGAAPEAQGAKAKKGKPAKPIIIGHRGASGYRPEHTLAAYELAARMGADFVEPDLVSTKDGVLVARHENEISGTTDVPARPEFASRRTTKTIDGVALTGWFTEDFTLAELRTLRAKERIPEIRQRNTLYDGRYKIPTFQEIIALRKRLSRQLGRTIGIYPETKHPTYFRGIGLALEPPLVKALKRNRISGKRAPVFVQSFETSNLRALNRQIGVRLVQLYGSKTAQPFDFVGTSDRRTYAELATPAGLRQVAKYADGVGSSKDYIVPRDPAGNSAAPTTFVADAHAAGLVVHPYTFRNENLFLPLELRRGADPSHYGRAFDEYAQFYALGVDGLFSDNPDTAVAARPRR